MDKIGEISYNKYGSKMKIIDYHNSLKVVVRFDDGYTTTTRYSHFKDGAIKNPYDKTVFGVGFIGEGRYNLKLNKKEGTVWRDMLRRSYDYKYHEKFPTYIGCTVCREWHNFQVFCKWYTENNYDFYEKLHLDKDILSNGEKIYSPYTCILIPQSLNLILTNVQKTNKSGEVGVCKKNKYGKY